ncbi:hypothetical protein [Muriicola sp.]|uniref:hypothetical protein n=1 Tax=Muriicola sp. TaxID=2020856 RepID=UPI003C73B9C9
MKYLCLFLCLVMGYSAHAQAVLNEFKYVIVPKKFERFRSENLYQSSTLVKYYLENQGFNALYEDALPQDLVADRCLGLVTSLEVNSSLFTTKVAVVFKDCQGIEQYRTQFGKSKAKEYKDAYRESIADAFQSLKTFKHSYKPKGNSKETVVLNFRDDVKELPAVVTKPKEQTIPVQTADSEIQRGEDKDKEKMPSLTEPTEVMEAISIEDAISEVTEPAASEVRTLYAQKTETGFQLVDTVPSIQFYVKETSLPTVFMAERKGQQGLIYKSDEQWIFEYYEGNDRLQEVLQIKF